jgi:putative hemolysin
MAAFSLLSVLFKIATAPAALRYCASAGGQARLTRHNAGPGLDQSGVQTLARGGLVDEEALALGLP